jgi:hypothetical protein
MRRGQRDRTRWCGPDGRERNFGLIRNSLRCQSLKPCPVGLVRWDLAHKSKNDLLAVPLDESYVLRIGKRCPVRYGCRGVCPEGEQVSDREESALRS